MTRDQPGEAGDPGVVSLLARSLSGEHVYRVTEMPDGSVVHVRRDLRLPSGAEGRLMDVAHRYLGQTVVVTLQAIGHGPREYPLGPDDVVESWLVE